MEEEKIELQKTKEDFDKIMENRQKKIEEEIELEKKKIVPSGSPESKRELPFEQRLYRKYSAGDPYDKWTIKKSPVLAPISAQSTTEFLLNDTQNIIVTPNLEQVEIQVEHVEENEHKIE